MSTLTEYLTANDKYAFFQKIRKECDNASDAYMFGLVASLLQNLVELVGEDTAANLSNARDRIRDRNEKAWEIVCGLED